MKSVRRRRVILDRMSALVPALVVLGLLLSACTGVLSGGGSAWQVGGLQQHDLRALEVDPNNSQHLYVGDAQGRVFASSDSGQHWSEQDDGLPHLSAIHLLAFLPDGKRLYAATDQGLFLSMDAARHWQAVATGASGLPSDGIVALAFATDSPQRTFVASSSGLIFVSSNNGTNWTRLSALAVGTQVKRLAYDAGTRELWAATTTGIYRLSGGASAWQMLHTGLPEDIVVNTVVPLDGAQNLLYAGTTHGFFSSTDDGAHWQPSHDTLARVSILDIQPDFRNASLTTLYIGTSVGPLRSDDGGQQWGSVASGIATGDPVYKLIIGGESNNQLYAAAGDGLYLYPGSGGGGFDPTRILAIAVAVLVFAVLYVLLRRSRKSRRELLKPERIL